jgi:hypothetical protein
MDDFFNARYASEIRKQFSEMDPDTASMMALMVAHDVTHQHVQDNRQVVSKRVAEILDDIATTVNKKLAERPVGPTTRRIYDEITKAAWDWGRGDPPWIGRNEDGQFAPKGYSYKLKQKGGNVKIQIKDKGSFSNKKGKPLNREANLDVTQALAGAKKQTNAFAERWTDPGDARSSTARTYNRIAAGSGLIAAAGSATGTPSVQLAGEMGQFAGSFGPQAEKVIGPSMRKTSYRYRGTERKLDNELVTRRREMIGQFRRNEGIPASEAGNVSPDQNTEVSRRAAIAHLQSKLPDKKLATLQVQSGKIPPSEGVIINADGKMITQAVGYMEDHYLPFNLKNLKGLQGGSYVRTRSSGGLTSEDIYTGLMSGARSVTVVSRSGVFTLDFEDDFRGQRRYSDKARQMVDRYEKTLDAVQSKTINRRGLTPDEKIQIREQTESEMSSMANTFEGRKMIEDTIKDREKDYQAATHLTSEELDAIDRKALGAASAEPVRSASSVGVSDRAEGGVGAKQEHSGRNLEQRYKKYRQELIEEAMADKEQRKLQLDGEGYATALNALREQYPYFLKPPRTTTQRENRPLSRETDDGYVRPRYNRPANVRSGYFDPDIEGPGGGKRPASGDNYQNYRGSRKKDEETAAPAGATEQGDKTKASAKSTGGVSAVRAQVDRQRTADKALAELAVFHAETIPSMFPDLSSQLRGATDLAEKEMIVNRYMKDKVKRESFFADVTRFQEQVDDDNLKARSIQLASIADRASNMVKSQKFDPNFTRSPRAPFEFDDIPAGRPKDYYAQQYRNLASTMNVPEGADDFTLGSLSESQAYMSDVFQRASEGKEPEILEVLLELDRLNVPSAKTEMLVNQLEKGDRAQLDKSAKQFREFANRTERLRALKAYAGEALSKPQAGLSAGKLDDVAGREDPSDDEITSTKGPRAGTMTIENATKTKPPQKPLADAMRQIKAARESTDFSDEGKASLRMIGEALRERDIESLDAEIDNIVDDRLYRMVHGILKGTAYEFELDD